MDGNATKSILDLQAELLLCIFANLSPNDISKSSRVCRSWHSLISSTDSLWKPHVPAVSALQPGGEDRALRPRFFKDRYRHFHSWSVTLPRLAALSASNPSAACGSVRGRGGKPMALIPNDRNGGNMDDDKDSWDGYRAVRAAPLESAFYERGEKIPNVDELVSRYWNGEARIRDVGVRKRKFVATSSYSASLNYVHAGMVGRSIVGLVASPRCVGLLDLDAGGAVTWLHPGSCVAVCGCAERVEEWVLERIRESSSDARRRRGSVHVVPVSGGVELLAVNHEAGVIGIWDPAKVISSAKDVNAVVVEPMCEFSPMQVANEDGTEVPPLPKNEYSLCQGCIHGRYAAFFNPRWINDSHPMRKCVRLFEIIDGGREVELKWTKKMPDHIDDVSLSESFLAVAFGLDPPPVEGIEEISRSSGSSGFRLYDRASGQLLHSWVDEEGFYLGDILYVHSTPFHVLAHRAAVMDAPRSDHPTAVASAKGIVSIYESPNLPTAKTTPHRHRRFDMSFNDSFVFEFAGAVTDEDVMMLLSRNKVAVLDLREGEWVLAKGPGGDRGEEAGYGFYVAVLDDVWICGEGGFGGYKRRVMHVGWKAVEEPPGWMNRREAEEEDETDEDDDDGDDSEGEDNEDNGEGYEDEEG
ncbi:hypothetical protein BJ742DRAFT_859863 [Cladochytrium replicatum]|nr:hypothetical protein BJ742DRAFT_859863 [Cladochytrium replicatum]